LQCKPFLFWNPGSGIKMLGRSEFALRQGFAAQNACGGALAPADETREAACIASRFCFT